MINWQTVALVAAATMFGFYVLWQVRPALGSSKKLGRASLREARAKIETAKDDEARGRAFCDAGDACAMSVGRGEEAAQYYLRAMRHSPDSIEIVERAISGLSKKPRALEKVLWRKLGTSEWKGAHKAVIQVALKGLVELYSGSLRDQVRARALENALAILD